MIACCSGADDNMEESLNTLKYANRARNIRNKPVVNRDPESAQLASMKDEIHALQQQLRMQQQAMAGGTVASSLANVHPDVSSLQVSKVRGAGCRRKERSCDAQRT